MALPSAQDIQRTAQQRSFAHSVEVTSQQPHHRPLTDRDKKLISEAYALGYLEGHIAALQLTPSLV